MATIPFDWTNDRFERITANLHWIGAGLAALALLFLSLGVSLELPSLSRIFLSVAIITILYAFIIIGLNLQYGYTGIVNFGPVMFFAAGGTFGAMAVARDPHFGVGFGLPLWAGVIIAVSSAVILGLIVGVATIRLRDDFLAILTLAAAEGFYDFIRTFRSIFGGEIGIGSVYRPFQELAVDPDTAMVGEFLFFLGLFLIAYKIVQRLTEAPYGRVLTAIRSDDLVATALGKNVFLYKLQTLVYGAALAGFAGFLYILHVGSTSASFFTIDVTVILWLGMLVGGAGSHFGVVIGLVIIQLINLGTRFLNEFVPYITQTQFGFVRWMLIGLFIMLVVRYKPEGFWGTAEEREEVN